MGVDRPRPEPDHEKFWTGLTAAPARLNATHDRWVIGSRLRDRLYDRRMVAAAEAGAADTERFAALLGLY
jgi:hypothetical protein